MADSFSPSGVFVCLIDIHVVHHVAISWPRSGRARVRFRGLPCALLSLGVCANGVQPERLQRLCVSVWILRCYDRRVFFSRSFIRSLFSLRLLTSFFLQLCIFPSWNFSSTQRHKTSITAFHIPDPENGNKDFS